MHHFLVRIGNAGKRDLPPRRRMTDRIADEIGDDLLDPLRIDDDHGVRNYIYFSRYCMAGCRDVKFPLLYQLLHDVRSVVFVKFVFHGLRRHLGELSQVGQKGSQHICFGIDHLQVRVRGFRRHHFIQQTFGVALDQCDRRFDLVRYVFQEFFLGLFCFFQTFFCPLLFGDVTQDALYRGNSSCIIADRDIVDLRPSLHDTVFVEHEDTAIRSFDRTGENAEDRAVSLRRVDVVEEPLRHFIKFFFTDADKG